MKKFAAHLVMLSALLASPAFAQAPAAPALPVALPPSSPVADLAPRRTGVEHVIGSPVTLSEGSTRVVSVDGAVATVIAADPGVVSVKPLSGHRLALIGTKEGKTTVTAVADDGTPIAQFMVLVTPSDYKAGAIAATMPPGASASPIPGGVRLHGVVRTPLEAMRAADAAKIIAGTGKFENDLAVGEPQQVILKVKIAEMSRSITQQLGINWQAVSSGISVGSKVLLGYGAQTVGNLIPTGSAGTYNAHVTFPNNGQSQLDAILNALDQNNLAHLLAEPTLTALSGHTASFISGGSFPVPVPGANGQTAIQFQKYGVQLVFRPVVLSNGQIMMQVNPTVSQVSNLNAVSVVAGNSTLVIPSLLEQSADTTVVLGSGQTLAIAGLLENQSNQTTNSVPLVSAIPGLGALARNDNFTRSQSELVVLVTPYLVRPRSNPDAFRVPGQKWTPPNLVQRFFLGRNDGGRPDMHQLPKNVGFILK